jgi:hypothetical protein
LIVLFREVNNIFKRSFGIKDEILKAHLEVSIGDSFEILFKLLVILGVYL